MPTALAPPHLVDQLVDATPTHRDRYVDLLRALSIGVVVLWHWVFSITHWTDAGRLTMPNPIGDLPLAWLATWFLQVMPLFFVVGGYANLAGWEANRRKGGSTAAFLRGRLSRLGRPAGVFVAVWAAVVVIGSVMRPGQPLLSDSLRVVFVPLWFLGVYAGVVLATPLTTALHRRRGGWALVGLGAAVLVVDLARFGLDLEAFGYVNTALVFVFAHQLGYSWRDGSLLAGGRRAALALTAGGLVALVGMTATGAYPSSMVAIRGQAFSNMFPTTAAIAALAVFQLGLALLLRPAANRWLARRSAWKAVVAVNGVAMTVFCWHMTALVLAILVWESVGGTLAAEPTAAWWLARPIWLALPALVLVPLVAIFARFERPAPRPQR